MPCRKKVVNLRHQTNQTNQQQSKSNEMEKQIAKIQRAMSLIGNKNYEGAFVTIYGNNIMTSQDFQFVSGLMESDRCNGDFFKACRIYEDTILQEEEAMANAFKSPKAKAFIRVYQDFNSGYAMGEVVKVKVMTKHRMACNVVKDNRETYSGRGNRFNKSIRHGEATLTIDLTGNRAKYSTDVVTK